MPQVLGPQLPQWLPLRSNSEIRDHHCVHGNHFTNRTKIEHKSISGFISRRPAQWAQETPALWTHGFEFSFVFRPGLFPRVKIQRVSRSIDARSTISDCLLNVFTGIFPFCLPNAARQSLDYLFISALRLCVLNISLVSTSTSISISIISLDAISPFPLCFLSLCHHLSRICVIRLAFPVRASLLFFPGFNFCLLGK